MSQLHNGRITIDYSTRKRLVRFVRIAETTIDVSALIVITLFLVRMFPINLIAGSPASGGDMGSHFWPLYTLVKHGLPTGNIPVWNPGNACGEPHLLHYFPAPFYIMAILSIIMPLGVAFNIGTLLHLLLLPFAVYLFLRIYPFRFPIPVFGAVLSMLFLYNESFSMWGGNALSTLSGQFAHGHALVWLLFGMAAFAFELRNKRFPLYSTLAFAAVCMSHAYVELAVPFILLSFLLFYPVGKFRWRFVSCIVVGVGSLLLSAWFLFPMIANKPWTYSVAMEWYSKNLLGEIVPPIMYVPLGLCGLLGPLGLILRRKHIDGKMAFSHTLFWIIPFAVYVVCYFIFTQLGLVDVRAIPQLQLIVCIVAAVFTGLFLQSFGRISATFLSIPILVGCLWWVDQSVVKLPQWMEWNYSGWEAKIRHGDLEKLSDHIRGSIVDPRIMYDHSVLNDDAGSTRVFELLPYFSGRATLESVYLESTILTRQIYVMQARISTRPSCPLGSFDCPKTDFSDAEAKLKLMGVGGFILREPDAIEMAQEKDYITETGVFGPWHVFQLNRQPSLVEVVQQVPKLASLGWKTSFAQWFRYYDGTQPLKYVADYAPADIALESVIAASAQEVNSCAPEVRISTNQIHLKTRCPGRLHLLKFVFHPTWKADSGDKVWLLSPGFMGVVPSKTEITLQFGESLLWRVSNYISLVSLLIIIVLAGFWRGASFPNRV